MKLPLKFGVKMIKSPLLRFLFVFVLLSFSVIRLNATTYYVDILLGDDSFPGTSRANPWRTVNKVNNSVFQPGDSILFRRGEIWKETLEVPSSGNAFQPIVFGSYGEGDLPILTGVDVYEGWNSPFNWSFVGNNIWSREQEYNPQRMWINGHEVLRNEQIDSLDGERYMWAWENSKIYVYSTENPAMAFNLMEINVFYDVVEIINKNYVVLQDIEIQGGYGFALVIGGSGKIVVKDCNIGSYSRQGIHIYEAAGISSTFVTIDNCVLDSKFNFSYGKDKGIDDGILVSGGANDCVIKNNVIKDFGHAGVYLKSLNAYDNGVYNNKVFGNYITGENVTYQRGIGTDGYENKCRDNEFFYNVIRNTTVRNQINGNNNWIHHNIIDGIKNTPVKPYATAQGFDLQCYGTDLVCHDNKIDNNLIMNCEEAGIYFRKNGRTKKNNYIRNNIILNCGSNSKEGYDNIGLVIDRHPSIETNYFYNNCIFSGDENSPAVYLRGEFLTVEEFNNQNSRLDVARNNIQKDPLIEISDSVEFHISRYSPCIDAGIDVGLSLDYYGNAIFTGNAPDIGIEEYYPPDGIFPWNSNVIKSFSLKQNYPNPFNPTTTISYSIPPVIAQGSARGGTKQSVSNVVLTVYNSLGQKIATLVNKQQAAGEYSVRFNAKNLPSGVYYYKLQSANFVQTRKMILLK